MNLSIPALACLLLTSCGMTFGPGFSADNTSYFQAPPHIVSTGDTAELIWNYGTMGFYFAPGYKVRNDALYFSLQATTSTGHVPGRDARISIKGDKALDALNSGGAYWWNSDGSATKLKINP